MDISIGNQAGVRKNFYEFPNDVGAALVHAGLAVQIAKPGPVPKVGPHWFVGNPPNGGRTDYILCWGDGTGAIQYFPSLTPAAAIKNPPVHCGLRCPPAVLETFSRLRGGEVDPEWAREQLRLQQDADAIRQQKEREQMHRWM